MYLCVGFLQFGIPLVYGFPPRRSWMELQKSISRGIENRGVHYIYFKFQKRLGMMPAQ